MEAILTSFCFSTSRKEYQKQYFYRMPPVCFRSSGHEFVPDYSVFFLCDAFYLDEPAVERIRGNHYFKQHSILIEALEETGRLKLKNFEEVITPYRDIIESSVNYDLRDITLWREPFENVVNLWNEFYEVASAHVGFRDFEDDEDEAAWESSSVEEHILESLAGGMLEGLDWRLVENLRNWRKRLPREYREFTRSVVGVYLEHVAANLCLSDVLGAVIHDWSDIGPLYERKLSYSIKVNEHDAIKQQDEIRKLFEIMFPKFEPRSVRHLVKALGDRRIESLRTLVKEAVAGKTSFDQDFANRTLKEVFKSERKIGKAKNIIGWATKPLSFVPWVGNVLETGTQEIANRFMEKRERQNHEWVYLLSDVAKHW